MTAPCPACGTATELFHEVSGVPVSSCVLVDTPEQARAVPLGDLRLGFCPGCGFVANTAFVPQPVLPGEVYEESQGFSPRFRAFADELASSWVERYGLVGRSVVEIGCGKGEFLARMAELTAGPCVGIDPAVVPGRTPVPARGTLRLIAEHYGSAHAQLQADALVCRHTLEHVDDVRAFLGLVRQGLAPGAVALFELPDAGRVLREGAVEDVYYEHCSYFTTGSLARLFRRCGLRVLDLRLEYEGQYLVVEAEAGEPDDTLSEADGDDIRQTASDVARFRASWTASRDHWRTVLERRAAEGGRTVLWGGSSKAVAFLTTLGVGDWVDAVVDINPHKQGRAVPGTGHPVVAPESLLAHPPDLVVLMNPVYVAEVRTQLSELGLSPVIMTLGRPSAPELAPHPRPDPVVGLVPDQVADADR